MYLDYQKQEGGIEFSLHRLSQDHLLAIKKGLEFIRNNEQSITLEPHEEAARGIMKELESNTYTQNTRKALKIMLTNATENAKQAYEKASSSEKKMLEQIFGAETFNSNTDWIELFDDFCKENNIDVSKPENALPYKEPTCDSHEAENAFKMILVISKWYRAKHNWIPDYYNSNEKKWGPYFYLSSGFRFDCSCYVYTYSGAYGGSRLCFKTEQDSTEAGKKFAAIYKKILTQ